MNNITIYSKDYCPYCKSAKALLESKGLAYTEVDVGHHPERLGEMITRSQRRTVPQIFFGDAHIGGSTDLISYFQKGLGVSDAA
ncbi:MAG: glutaredoxin 3 [Halioglobus sp.]